MTAETKPERDQGTDNGFTALGAYETTVLTRLDSVFAGWAERARAKPMTVPAMQPVADLASLGVYQNFPHLSWVATTLSPRGVRTRETNHGTLERDEMEPASFGLPSAVCYGVYLYYRDQSVPDPTLVTAVSTCYRNETHYEGLRRLGAFRMREIVALGTPDSARAHLDRFSGLIERFADRLGLPLRKERATDPFFDPEGAEANWQKVAPVKYEFQYGDLAIASVNEHRKFFGERCRIRDTEAGSIISTSCVAFGLERWVHALTDRYQNDHDAVLQAIDKADAE